MLSDRYYIGKVNYQDKEYEGRHEPPLIDEELFDRVQETVKSRGKSQERRRVNRHYLTGTLYCAECRRDRGINQRLVVQRVVGKNGGEYFYFFCPGRQKYGCTQPHHDLFEIERAVERHYRKRRISPPEFVAMVRSVMAEAVDDQVAPNAS